jgi:uncharacterized membrane protein YphA (DoxX/SURF4 family)
MNRLTQIFLVLLRLAIGWHFLFEGLEKIQSVHLGPTESNRPWTSEGYLREASGPFGGFFRSQLGPDPDQQTLDRLSLAPLPPDQDLARTPPYKRFPPALYQDWQAFLDRFARHYGLEDQQRQLAEKKLQQRMDQTVQWLLTGTKKVRKTFPSGTVEVEQTTPQRVQEYREKVRQVNDIPARELPAFGRDVQRQKLRAAKAELNRMRADLLADLGEQNVEMKRALQEVLTDDQKKLEPVPEAIAIRPVDWIDWLTPWGLTLIGACLLFGLFTRTACVAGAAFLLTLYLAMPPFPWLPETLRTEGHYLFVNKNVIEMLALLTLATTASGRWAGLDGLVQFLSPWRRPGDGQPHTVTNATSRASSSVGGPAAGSNRR